MLDRRDFLVAAGTALGGAFLAADPKQLEAAFRHGRQLHDADAQGQQRRFDILTPEQVADLEAVSSQIIPTDDLPGAREAGVVGFIDRSLGSWAVNQREPLLNALNQFNAGIGQRYTGVARYALLTPAQQQEYLRAGENTPLFGMMRFMTLVGTFGHPDWGGNVNGAGWQILGYDPRGVWEPPFGWYDARANGGPN